MLDYFTQLFNTLLENPWLLGIAIIFATFLAEDPVTLLVGSLIASAKVEFWHGIIPLFIGIFLGDLGLYFIGRFFSEKNYFKRFKRIKLESISLLFWARFVPGMRVTTYPAAGFSKVNVWTFTVVNLASSVIWTGLLLKGTNLFILLLPESLRPYQWLIVIGLIVVLVLIESWVRKKVAAKKSQNLQET